VKLAMKLGIMRIQEHFGADYRNYHDGVGIPINIVLDNK